MSLRQTNTVTPDVSHSNHDSVRSVVLPIYDESIEHWTQCVEDLTHSGWDEIILALDAPDTASKQEAIHLEQTAEVVLSLSAERRGKGKAIRDGLHLATGEVIGFVDADGAVSASDLDRIYRAVEDNTADIAIGSRNTAVASRDGQSDHRRILGAVYRRLARYATGVSVSDFQCGAKAFHSEVWDHVSNDLTEAGYAIDTELLARAHRYGFEISEVPITWRDPGNSQVSVVRDVPDMFVSLFRLRRSLAKSGPMRVALVSDHPPNRGHLAEYGEELASAYAQRNDIDITVLSRLGADGEDCAYDVHPIWARDSSLGALHLLRHLRGGGYDAIHYNIHMTYFGDTDQHRFLGLSLPLLTRLLVSAPVMTTLHDMLEVVDPAEVAEEVSLIERIGARIATQLVLLSDVTTVTAERYREAIERRYFGDSIVHIPHGTFQRTDGGISRIEPPLRLLQFGFLGPTKDIPTTVKAFRQIRAELPDAELIVAGGSHPDYPGYQQALADRYGSDAGITFTGYIEDEELDRLWHDASLLVMPYRTATGVSGVFQLAKSYGLPVVAYDSESLRTSTIETGGSAAFVPPRDDEALAACILDLWNDREQLDTMARDNAEAAAHVSMSEVVDQMVHAFVEEAGLDHGHVEVRLDV